jgi:predicted metalloendopeptidase
LFFEKKNVFSNLRPLNRDGDFFPSVLLAPPVMGALAGSGGNYGGMGASVAHQLIQSIMEYQVW